MLTYQRIYEGSAALFVLFIVLFPKLAGISYMMLLLVFIGGLIKKELKFRWNPTLGLMLTLYLSYVLMKLTKNEPPDAEPYLEYKVALILLPLFFLFRINNLSRANLIPLALITAVLGLALAGLINAFMIYSDAMDCSVFAGSYFSFIHHPTYFSAYAFTAMIIVSSWSKNTSERKTRWVLRSLFFILCLVQFLCASLAGLVVLVIYLSVEFLILIRSVFGKRVFYVALLLTPFLIVLSFKMLPGLKAQYNTSVTYLQEYLKDPTQFISNKQTYVGGNETRLIMWTASYLELRDHPAGVGPGNLNRHLGERLESLGQPPQMVKKKLNPHNQYLQTGLETGIAGLIVLLSIVILVIYGAIRKSEWLLLAVILNLAFNMLFESMLQRQSGIVFFVFFISLLSVYPKILSSGHK